MLENLRLAHDANDSSVLQTEYEELLREIARMRSILRILAYPKRGTHEERMTLQDFADLTLSQFTREQLGLE